ncbi:methyltransferase [Candidatus Woesearchaeota archaeon]|nr:methyltransferase [Candidatus Woesearchaeota archaeon]
MSKLIEKGCEIINKPWHPDKPTSKGATAFHEAVANSSWIKDIMHELAVIADPRIKSGDVIVDFGAGTGTSAQLLLKYLQKKIRMWLVDNSPSWLGKAYEILSDPPNVECFILERRGDKYAALFEVVGQDVVDHVISANTVHLIPDINETFCDISVALKKGGDFIFQTGNFVREGKPDGALMIDDTIEYVHDIALDIVRKDPKFRSYSKNIEDRVKTEAAQRRLVFPKPRHIKSYLNALESAGLECASIRYLPVKVTYSDWLNFLRVRRLQAGILPEIGGKEPNPEIEKGRDELITMSALKLFKELKMNNPLADDKSFTVECAYVSAMKS